MLSRYTVVSPIGENQTYILYNTLFQNAVCVNPELYELIQNGRTDPDLMERYREEWETLERMGIIIGNGSDEREKLRQWFRSFQDDASYINVNILTTNACNLACVYCYEEGRKKALRMNEETTGAVLDWMKERIGRNKPEEIRITFYGGEPLLHLPPIEWIAGEMRHFGRNQELMVKCGIITNGVLLDREMANQLRDFGIDDAKITLDGIGEVHDRKRPDKKGNGTFDVICRNLRSIRGVLPVNITCNFDNESYDSAKELPAYLKKEGLKPSQGKLRFKPIKQTDTVLWSSLGCQSGGYTMEEVRQMLELREILQGEGYETDEDFSLGPCEYHHKNSFTIDVDGEIYPCGGFPGIREHALGNVASLDEEAAKKGEEIPSQCLECRYFPSCGGGCRFLSYLRSGNPGEITCEKSYFEVAAGKILEGALQSQLSSE